MGLSNLNGVRMSRLCSILQRKLQQRFTSRKETLDTKTYWDIVSLYRIAVPGKEIADELKVTEETVSACIDHYAFAVPRNVETFVAEFNKRKQRDGRSTENASEESGPSPEQSRFI